MSRQLALKSLKLVAGETEKQKAQNDVKLKSLKSKNENKFKRKEKSRNKSRNIYKKNILHFKKTLSRQNDFNSSEEKVLKYLRDPQSSELGRKYKTKNKTSDFTDEDINPRSILFDDVDDADDGDNFDGTEELQRKRKESFKRKK